MSLMQIDSPSPSHATCTPRNGMSLNKKRTRSASMGDASERPIKRVIPDSAASSSSSHATTPAPIQLSAALRTRVMLERGLSNDWVTKTSGLRLNSPGVQGGSPCSPQLPGGHHAIANANAYHHEHLEQMQTDLLGRPAAPYSSYPLSHPPGISSGSSWHTEAHAASPEVHGPDALALGGPASPEEEDTQMHSAPASPSWRSVAVSMSMSASTASTAEGLHHHQPHHVHHHHHPLAHAHAHIVPLRRPRIAMGPRADCDKCRSGVKNHWMHFE